MSATLPRAAAPLALMAVIFWLSSQPDPGPDAGELGNVVAHFTEFALLAALWAWALAPALGSRAHLAAGAIALLYAISDELHQLSVPGRHADPLDVLVDAAGIATALLVISRMGDRRRARRAGAPPP